MAKQVFFQKNLSVFSKNLKLILKERRFLYFTKKGPIEVVFNIKHYLSAVAISLVLIFKVFQLLFFGVSSFFSYMVYKNTVINEQSFTESEIKALKSIAKGKNISEQEINSEKAEIVIKQEEFTDTDNIQNELQDQLREKLLNLKSMMRNIKLSFPNDVNYSDEIKFEQFSKLASPEMIAIEHAFENKSDLTKPSIEKKNHLHIENCLSYRLLLQEQKN